MSATATPAVTDTPPPVARRPRVEALADILIGLDPGGSVSATNLTWAEYQHLQAVRDEHRPGVRLVFDGGRFEAMSHGYRHERWKCLIAVLVRSLLMGLRRPVVGAGNVTMDQEAAEKGLEPDVCFYIQSAARVQAILDRDLNFETDPPPDLAVEVEMTRGAVGKLPIYAALKVPEVWRWDGERLAFLHLTPAGVYAERPVSLAIPVLTPDLLTSYLRRAGTVDESTLCLELQAWADAARTATPGTA